VLNNKNGKGGETMKVKRFLQYLMVVGLVTAFASSGTIAQDQPSSTSEENLSAEEPGQAGSESYVTFKNYPDHLFHLKAKEYIRGMQRGGHNLLIWRDPAVDLSQYRSVVVTEFDGRLLPQQNIFSYDPYITIFNATFKGSLTLTQKDAADALLIEGAVVECNPGNRAARALVGFGAGRAGAGVVCEVYQPGEARPCIRIYTRDTSASSANYGGNSVMILNNIMTVLAQRLAATLNVTVAGSAPAPRRGVKKATRARTQPEEPPAEGEGQ
jgi:hypothetical protein